MQYGNVHWSIHSRELTMLKMQMLNAKLNTKKYKISGMDCASCATLLELDMEDVGISCKCSYPKEELEVNLESDIHEAKFMEVITKSGYKISPF